MKLLNHGKYLSNDTSHIIGAIATFKLLESSFESSVNLMRVKLHRAKASGYLKTLCKEAGNEIMQYQIYLLLKPMIRFTNITSSPHSVQLMNIVYNSTFEKSDNQMHITEIQ